MADARVTAEEVLAEVEDRTVKEWRGSKLRQWLREGNTIADLGLLAPICEYKLTFPADFRASEVASWIKLPGKME